MLEKLEKLSIWIKLGILVFIVAIMGVYYHQTSYSPFVQEKNQLEEKKTKLDSELANVFNAREQLKEFKREYTFLENKLELTLSILPRAENMNELLIQLESLATRSGLTITKFDPNSRRSKNFYYEYPIELNVSGGYHELAYFCMEVANMERIVNLSDLSIDLIKKSNRQGKGGPTIIATMEATAFAFKTEKEVLEEVEKDKNKGKKGKRRGRKNRKSKKKK